MEGTKDWGDDTECRINLRYINPSTIKITDSGVMDGISMVGGMTMEVSGAERFWALTMDSTDNDVCRTSSGSRNSLGISYPTPQLANRAAKAFKEYIHSSCSAQ
jgi:hypothetical protein